ncbi:ribose-phosphate diphosphokinase [Thermococcus zilligii]|uniref:ribose-phosphate diphosphokinase n=1 Tax=Thermococcus zilligii TaxID=54076 RepID=UPI000496AFEF|nr:ribose-phosphate diphosphokinase [Thermococcus zilligii]
MIIVGSGALHLKDELLSSGAEVEDIEISRFPDGEKYVRVPLSGREATVVQSTYRPQNENLIEALLIGDALRERGFERLKLVVPYLAYSRQDRITKEGEPISVRAVMRTLGLYYDELYVVDIHNPKTLDFFPGKAFNVSPAKSMADYFGEKLGEGVVLSPDEGALSRARGVAEELGVEYGHFEKRRISPTQVEMRPVEIDVRGKNVLIVDDIISTGGTMIMAAEILRKLGAKKIFVGVTHGVFAEGAVEKVSNAVDELAVTNTIPTPVSKISVVPEIIRVLQLSL